MKLQPDELEKPLRKLRKQLNTLSPNPRPEDVHSLRTQSRRLEATITAMALEREKQARRLIKLIKPVRKAAGNVRDMDVLIGDVLTTCGNEGGDPAVRLIQHLARMRLRNARRLHDLVQRRRSNLRTRLKQSSKLIRRKIKEDGAGMDGQAAPRILITELSHWPGLEEANLHLFRIRIKELRYMLQLHEQADRKLVDLLGEVKDAIGEWHDWGELEKIANSVLDAETGSDLLKRIEKTRAERLQVALTAANRVRDRYFGVPDGRKTGKKILQMAS
ncbi:MAG TPA: CHAD domain-containing protein [Terracidiphilus sp.]